MVISEQVGLQQSGHESDPKDSGQVQVQPLLEDDDELEEEIQTTST